MSPADKDLLGQRGFKHFEKPKEEQKAMWKQRGPKMVRKQKSAKNLKHFGSHVHHIRTIFNNIQDIWDVRRFKLRGSNFYQKFW